MPSEARTVRRKSSSPARPSRRGRPAGYASRRASGCTGRRSSARSSRCAAQEVDLVGQRRHGGARDRPGPFSSATRRRTSASTAARRPRSAPRAVCRATCSASPPRRSPASMRGQQRGDEGLRRERPQHPVGEPGLPPRLARRTCPSCDHGQPGEPAHRLLVAVEQQLGEARRASRPGRAAVRSAALAARPRRRRASLIDRRRSPSRRRPPQVEEQVEGRPVRRAA